MSNQSKINELIKSGTIKQGSFIEYAEKAESEKSWKRYAQKVAFNILMEIKKQGIDQKILGQRMGVSKQQVNRWVKGSQNFTLETIEKFESALNIKLLHFYEQQSELQEAVGFSFNESRTTVLSFFLTERTKTKYAKTNEKKLTLGRYELGLTSAKTHLEHRYA